MTLLISDLITPEERDDVVATLLAIAALLDAPTTSWQEGNPILTQLMTAAQKMADLTVLAVEITKGGFGELLPSDAWADRWALSRFNVTRVPAEEATGFATFTCSASAIGDTYDAGEIIIAHSVTGKTYRNAASVVVVPSTTLTDQPIVADEVGTASNAAPSAITVMVSSIVGVTVSNAESVLGADKETTPALVTRARKKLGALSPNGPKDIYEYVATTPEYSATSTPITRTRTVLDEATGDLNVYLATASGAPIAGDVTIVQTAFDTVAEPWGANASAIAASEQTQAITYHSWVQGSNLTAAQIEALQATALAEFFATLAIGGDVLPPDTGDLYVETLQQVIGAAVTGTRRVVVSLPAAAVPITANKVFVLGTITPTTTLT